MKNKISVIAIAVFGICLCLGLSDYFYSYDYNIPIERMNDYRIPCTSVEIEGIKYKVEIDLGSKTALSLHEDVLNKIKKDPCGSSRRLDFLGNKYETPLYNINNVRTGSYFLKQTKAREESLEYSESNSIIIKSTEEHNAGRIGREFFEGKNLFFDLSHNIFIVCSKLKDLKKKGYDLENFPAIPFKNTSKGIVFDIETDLGIKKLMLDTGSTGTAIRNSGNEQKKLETFQTSQFVMNGVDFGPRKIYLLNITPLFEGIDGFLGMDFLNEHVVYLDFTKQVAYIGKTL